MYNPILNSMCFYPLPGISEEKMKRAPKAYKNLDFLNSSEARTLRVLSEYLEPQKRFVQSKIKHTVVFFGSARVRPNLENDPYGTGKYYWAAEEFAYLLGNWSKTLENNEVEFALSSGGGPGIMEAANRGAQRAGIKSIGLNISLPFEQNPNDYITEELNFEFHYFFMRKLWFLYHAKALVVFPGGFGTLDEMFETLTLIQTHKIQKYNIPVLLYDPTFWKDLINFPKLVEYGLISPEDVHLFQYFSTPEEGIKLLTPPLEKIIRDFRA
jgi:uncharacterized protein (TIGR00730 family)